MNERKIPFTMRLPASVIAELRQRAKLQSIGLQDLARFHMERSLAIASLEEVRAELILAAGNLISGGRDPGRPAAREGDISRACLRSILFTEQYLRCLALKQPDPLGTAERAAAKKLKELSI